MTNGEPRRDSAYWKSYWDKHGASGATDYEVDRGTALKISKLQRRSDELFLRAVQPSPGDVLLDAGCGTGANISKLSGRVAKIVAIDFSPEMIHRAQKRVIEEALGNVSLAVASITSLEYADGTFDKVICTSVLQYLDDQDCRQAIREMIRVCRRGGSVILHVKNSSSLYGLSLIVVKGVLRAFGRQPKPDRYRTWRWYKEAVVECGGQLEDWDSFGKLTFVPLPRAVVGTLLDLEVRFLGTWCLRKHGVNLQLTVKAGESPRSDADSVGYQVRG